MDHTAYVAAQEEVKALKRAKRDGDALGVLWRLVEQTESDVRQAQRDGVESWPYQQLAIVYRKQNEYAQEVAALERYLRQTRSHSKQGKALVERLGQAYVLTGQAESREGLLYITGTNQLVDEADIFRGTAAFLDTETTGMTREDELIELGIVLFQFSHMSGRMLGVVDSYSGLREPGCAIHPAAEKKHGISARQVRGQRLDNGKVERLLGQASLLISHNASYDRRFVSALFPATLAQGWYCSMNGVKWGAKGFASKGLQNLLVDHGVQPQRAHRALDDALSALTLLGQVDTSTGVPYLAELLAGPCLSPPKERNDDAGSGSVLYLNFGDFASRAKRDTEKPSPLKQLKKAWRAWWQAAGWR